MDKDTPMFYDVALPGLEDLTTQPAQDVAITDAARRRFWNRVEHTDSGCWFWTGAVASDGYGRITWTHRDQPRTLSTHRFALHLAHGWLPAGLVAQHTCNHPLCVRVGGTHLFLGQQSDNILWAVHSGRHDGRRTVVNSRERRANSLRQRHRLTGSTQPLPGDGSLFSLS